MLAFLLHFWNLHEILHALDTKFLIFEALLSPEETLKVKVLSKFLEVNFWISENGSAVNVLSTILLKSLTAAYTTEVWQQYIEQCIGEPGGEIL